MSLVAANVRNETPTKLRTPNAQLRPSVTSGSPNTDGDVFYVLETRWLVRNRVYRIWASPRGLAAAYVAGAIYNEASARLLALSF